jgi:hypothetical protein
MRATSRILVMGLRIQELLPQQCGIIPHLSSSPSVLAGFVNVFHSHLVATGAGVGAVPGGPAAAFCCCFCRQKPCQVRESTVHADGMVPNLPLRRPFHEAELSPAPSSVAHTMAYRSPNAASRRFNGLPSPSFPDFQPQTQATLL